jgi:SAM-dependent methyltransferase
MKLCLNVGSGQRAFVSTDEVQWVNIDKIKRDGMQTDLVADGASLPQADASVDYFVLHHVLEHFWPGDAKALVIEAHRVLKPGGSLLVFVPNLQVLASRWLGGELETQLYLTNVYGAYMGNPEDYHKWGFTPQSLADFLWEHAPWGSMRPFDWREIPGADFAKDYWIMACEVVK